ncbi:MAG: NADP-dependent oxidoreductase [Planctomycetaceae bacterium]|nr:NADP-dependent oxidoreductase [Planctomycetaceae bacterium]
MAMATQIVQKTMKAITIDQFGGIDELKPVTLSVPAILDDEILIRVESAGVGVWDPFEREGGFADMLGIKPKFPYVIGTEGAGTIAAIGRSVDQTKFKEGDRVYAASLANPKGGFYAEFAAVKAENVSHIPGELTTLQAGALAIDAITALQGLDLLDLKRGQSVLIFGASGGIGHLAVQFARRMGLRVLAAASGDDGVELVQRLGADWVLDGHKGDVAEAAGKLVPGGLDGALLTAGGEAAERALEIVRQGGRVAYPNGVEPVPQPRSGLTFQSYDGLIDRQTIDRINRLVEAGSFDVCIAHAFPLEQAADAHRALEAHFLGKIVLVP